MEAETYAKIVLATGNPGKVRELNALLLEQNIEVLPQTTFAVPEIAETGSSFEENALLKARNAAHHTGLPAIADDSGLEVDALQGAPGIYSARYAGPGATDADNIAKLLAAMRGVSAHKRSARFQCVLVYLRHAEDPKPLICRGTWEGFIAQAPFGDAGFGYDPIFLLPPLGKTAAELHPNRKNQLSHRAMALAQLADRLQLG
ncbi:MAG: RdgB/HAM1 family non-canonical purine NTP pyrophosphatase [Candidatus Competibacteraceae bacterium]|nr:RdgB/HAM1 family non-canonical purine NTP pyrophosphatase [Candidatus Competibacteraceae bacterium]